MAPTEGRVARPERRWGCRRGTVTKFETRNYVADIYHQKLGVNPPRGFLLPYSIREIYAQTRRMFTANSVQPEQQSAELTVGEPPASVEHWQERRCSSRGGSERAHARVHELLRMKETGAAGVTAETDSNKQM